MATTSTEATSRDYRHVRRTASMERASAAAKKQQQKQPTVTEDTGGGGEVTLETTEIRGVTGNIPLGSMPAATTSVVHMASGNTPTAGDNGKNTGSGMTASTGNPGTSGGEPEPSSGGRDVTWHSSHRWRMGRYQLDWRRRSWRCGSREATDTCTGAAV
ncbi:hypothetical protein PHYPSEUDO_008610 [Phytophthora pseudosyringae]|uniref:Uncharacterized protein n=1 Tax=Phytophthora pseudosyringae TaxID=221518 RepID=A0A8T1WA21_9STRA|nr:hypothetical protein PHYPSEUDO_008610 [Phytophthora pseudosyringae]